MIKLMEYLLDMWTTYHQASLPDSEANDVSKPLPQFVSSNNTWSYCYINTIQYILHITVFKKNESTKFYTLDPTTDRGCEFRLWP